jgi:hydrogenase maturation factor
MACQPSRKGSALVGDVIPEEKGILLVEKGRERLLEHPRIDPFWIAFDKALTQGDRTVNGKPHGE